MNKHIIIFYLIVVITGCFLFSCKKYLDEKPNSNLTLPRTARDFQLLLDNPDLNEQGADALLELIADNYYVNTSVLNGVSNDLYSLYNWQPVQVGYVQTSWQVYYKFIYSYSNVSLDYIDKVQYDNIEEVNNVKGSALFIRSLMFYYLAQLYCSTYDEISAKQKLGIVLRLNADLNEKSFRSTVAGTYSQILNDLKFSAELLPVKPLVKTRPSKPAAYGAIAKTYLAMKQYDSAGFYANKCLQLYDSLMDYNNLVAEVLAPIPRFNKEIIYYIKGRQQTSMLAPSRAKIDSTLYQSYSGSDLRKGIFFSKNTDNSYRFKGDYDGSGTQSGYVFGGIVTDEMYLIRAESKARAGLINDAMRDLDTLLRNRWDNKVPYIPMTAINQVDAVKKVLLERRKELLFRGTRWTDLRRLKDEPDYSVTPMRKIDDKIYKLEPNNPRYTLLIPQSEINQSGIEQNL